MEDKIESIYPLSPTQEGMLFHKLLNENSTEYFVRYTLKLTGELELSKVRESLDLTSQRYEVLRTSIIMPKKGARTWQVVLKDRQIELNVIDLSMSQSPMEQLEQIKQDDLNRGFDLEKDSLLRMTAVKLFSEESIILCSLHHIILDGWGCVSVLTNFIQNYAMLCNGESFDELKKKIIAEKANVAPYGEYIKWLEKQDKKTALKYWEGLLEDYSEIATILPIGTKTDTKEEMDRITLHTSCEFTEAVKKVAKVKSVTINTILETGLGILLQKYNNTNDVVFGKVVSGRNADIVGIDQIVGLFINTIPVRVKNDSETNCEQLLEKMYTQAMDSSCYDYCSLADIQSQSSCGSELIKVLFVYENYYIDEAAITQGMEDLEGKLKVEAGEGREQTNYPITVSVSIENTLDLDVMYDPRLFRKDEIQMILDRYRKILQEVVEHPEQKIAEIDVVAEAEKEKIIKQFNDSDVVYPKDKTVVKLFEEQAARVPNKIAVASDGKKITYRELNQKANQLALKLRKLGVKSDDYVAVMAERRIETIIGICGIIKAGGAYVPIDPAYPKERIDYMLDDCKPKALLLYDGEYKTGLPVVDLSEAMQWEGLDENIETVNKADDLIYLIYTSGTSGKPKGVMIEHKSVIRLVHNVNYVRLDENTVILQTGSLSFDASTFEIWGALLNGGEVYLAGNDVILDAKTLKKVIEDKAINTMFLTTALFNQLINSDETVFERLDTLLFGGEKTSEIHVRKLVETNQKINFANIYGPTETTTFATWYPIKDKILREKTPIGKPISNTKGYVVNGLKLCGIGMLGELCIAGDGVARGYLNRPELTTEKFVPNPFGEGKIYRSGDLVKWLPDGNIEYLGRIDEQIKLRGFRIELGEIESVIRKQNGVKDVVVIVSEDNGEKSICAYIVAQAGVNIDDIREGIKKELPDYMVPAYMMKIEKIPVTRNGKLDKKALPQITTNNEYEYVAPRNEMEKVIAQIFEAVLGIKQVGINNNFFEIGGHSLKATRVINQIEEATGVRLPLKEMFEEPTVEGLCKKIRGKEKKYVQIPKVEPKEIYPMSSSQKRIFVICGLDNTGILYNMNRGMEANGKLDVNRINSVFNQLIKRHESLRTSFIMKDGEALQKISKKISAEIEHDEIEQASEAEKIRLFNELVRPFDLEKAPLVRIKVIKVKNGNDLIFFDMHHIISDGMSINIIAEDFTRLYAGEKLEDLNVQYKDYSEWMRTRDISDQKTYWINEFKDEIPVLDLPLDYKRPQTQSFNGKCIKGIIEKEIREQTEALSRQTGTTEYMVLLSALMILLSKYSRQEDIVVGSPISGRVNRDTEKILGMFVNTLAMRGEPKGKKTFKIFLKEMKEKCLKAQENQEYPFDELVEEIEVNRDLSRNPLFDVIFSFQNVVDDTELEVEGITFKEIAIEHIISKFDLTVTITNMKKGYGLTFEYCIDLFKESSIRQMMSHFNNILREITLHPERKLADIEVVDEVEKEKIITYFNDTDAVYPKDKSVVNLFEEQSAWVPNKIAVASKEKTITYRELNRKANQLAVKLREFGVKPNDFVAVMAERRIETIIGICGIIKAGGAYVPIDPAYPKERIDYMLNDCKPKALLLYDREYKTSLSVVDLSEVMQWKGFAENVETVNKADDLIYLIYTSGTTGKPKGVMIEHRSVIRLVHNVNYVRLDENTVILQTGALSFDASTFEIWGALLNGGEVYLAGNDVILDAKALKRVIEDNVVNTMFITTALFNQLINSDKTVFDGLDNLLFGGEKTSEIHVRKLVETNPRINFTNVYGPTETTTYATWYPINGNILREKTPIGKPISNTKTYVLNGLKLCGIGMAGELCIAGDGVARGYLNCPELAAEKFVVNPFGEGKMYRSGDVVRWLPDGNIEFLGRIDEQIKLRGFRIELAEIESVIRKLNGVQDVVVIVSEAKEEKNISAYIVAESGIDIGNIREELRKELPDYMIPAYMMKIEKILVNRNGKVDKKALPTIEVKSEHEYVAPRNETETVIVRIFEEVLGIDRIGIRDNFFEIGGDSIKAIRVVSKLREKNYSVSMREIVQQRTIEQIITSIRKVEKEVEYNQEEITGEVALTPIQKTLFQWRLLKPNHFNQSMIIKANQGLNEEAVKQTLRAIVKHHDILRAVFNNDKQVILSVKDSKMFELKVYDFRNFNDETLLKKVEDENTKLQGSMDLSSGPLLKAALYQTSDGDHLIICIHHLVIDGVSWRILIEDFQTGYKQSIDNKKITLPKKTLSYQEWSNALIEYSKSENIQNEITYWKRISEQLTYGHIERDADGTESGYGNMTLGLGAEKTSQLLYEAGKAYATEINDILLATLGIAYQLWQGKNKLVVQLEGHGREEIHKKLHIDRTIGWFTSIYPIVLEASDSIRESIINTKEMLRSIPNHGIGYSVIKHSRIYEIPDTEVDISFNYLGEIGGEKKDNSEIEKSLLPDGIQIAKENIFSNIILNGVIIDGKFIMEIWYNKGEYSQNAIEKLIKCYERMLNEVIEHCTNSAFLTLTEDKAIDNLNVVNRELQVITSNIFALKRYDVSNFMKTQLFKELMCYEDNIKGVCPDDCFEPFAYQRAFLVEFPEVCCARTDILGMISQNKLIGIIKDIIKEQSVFRVSYDKDNNCLQQFKYTDNWYVPYLEIRDNTHVEEEQELFESVLNVPQLFEDKQLLAKIIIVKVALDKHYIYFYIHHALWDLVSTEVLSDIVKAKFLRMQERVIENLYTDYIKARKEKENQIQLQKDARQFVDKFFKQMDNYDSLMKGKAPQYRAYIKYKFKAEDTLEKLLEDPLLWVIKLFSLTNIVEPNDYIEKTFPFLLMHFGRDDKGLRTLGLYLEVIPYMFNVRENKILSLNHNDKCNYGNLIFNPEYYDPKFNKEHFKNVPVVNFYADLEMKNVFDDFEEYNIEIRDEQGINIIVCRIFKDVLYLILPIIDNDEKRISKVVNEYLGLSKFDLNIAESQIACGTVEKREK